MLVFKQNGNGLVWWGALSREAYGSLVVGSEARAAEVVETRRLWEESSITN